MARMYLVVVEDGTRNDLVFERPTVSIGRGLPNDVRLRDPRVSRRHCRIETEGTGFVLVDEGSQNGTLLNGTAVSRAPLAAGDVVQIGKTRIFFGGSSPPPEDAEALRGAVASAEGTAMEEVARERDNLLALQRINRALNSETDPAALLPLVVDSAISLCRAERGFLILDRAEGTEGAALRYEVARDFAGETVSMPPEKFLKRIAVPVRETGRPLFVVDASEDERFRDALSIEEMRLRSVMAVPMRVRGEVEGVLAVDHRLQRGAFSEDDLDLLDALADQAGIALGNARLVARLRETAARAERLASELAHRVDRQAEEIDTARVELEAARGTRYTYETFVGRSRAMREVFRLLDRVVGSDFPVLLQGESGTGKELVARAIHEKSVRRRGRFVAESCAALPDHLLTSELFGHTRGAFTGAERARKGLFELADGGVLFLDEVSEMSPDLQRKLLRVLEDGEVRPLGADRPVKVDVRVLVASNRDLADLVREGRFREDLYFRLNVLALRLPALRERPDDVPLLVEHFLGRLASESGTARKRVRPEVLEALAAYSWPGNVRELEHEVRKWIVFAGDEIGLEALSREIREGLAVRAGAPPPDEAGTLPDRVGRLEVRAIRDALSRESGNKTGAARHLGISRFTLQRKMAKYGVPDPEG